MSRERRSFARLYVGVEANYKPTESPEAEKTVLVQDISLSGVRFISNEVLSENMELNFTLNIPDIPQPLSTMGKVVWQKKFSDSYYDTGIDFFDLEESAKQALTLYINRSLGRVKENRDFIRSNLSTMVTYKLTDEPEAEENRCISVDISPSGIKVFSKQALAAGTNIQLSFCLPDDTELISAQGKVMWSKITEEKFAEIGIEFTDIDHQGTSKINAYVRKTLGIVW
jgi:c-di-GMP-binding flagellar brake protein YcgR